MSKVVYVYVVNLFHRTPTLEWYMTQLGVKDGPQKDMWYSEPWTIISFYMSCMSYMF